MKIALKIIGHVLICPLYALGIILITPFVLMGLPFFFIELAYTGSIRKSADVAMSEVIKVLAEPI